MIHSFSGIDVERAVQRSVLTNMVILQFSYSIQKVFARKMQIRFFWPLLDVLRSKLLLLEILLRVRNWLFYRGHL